MNFENVVEESFHHGQDFDLGWEEKILKFLEQNVGVEKFTPGLSRLIPYLSEYRDIIKIRNIKVITIAGTNGKGETCHFLQKMLSQSGYNVALWTSPHILSIRERMQFNDQMISYEELWQSCLAVEKTLDKQQARLTFYELLFVVFIQWALGQSKCDFLILEVGLGGRFDGVNFFDADYALLTSISRDHQEILGKRLEQILKEKLGILRSGTKFISSLELCYLQDITREHCKMIGAQWEDLFVTSRISKTASYTERNRALAHAMCREILKIKNNSVSLQGSLTVTAHFGPFKGRNERVTIKGQRFIFIGAHNLDGMRKLNDFLKEKSAPQNWLVAFSKRDLTDVIGMVKVLVEANPGYIWPSFFEHPKALSLGPLKEVLSELQDEIKGKVHPIVEWKKFIDSQKQGAPEILVTGSYYFIGEVQKYLLQKYVH